MSLASKTRDIAIIVILNKQFGQKCRNFEWTIRDAAAIVKSKTLILLAVLRNADDNPVKLYNFNINNDKINNTNGLGIVNNLLEHHSPLLNQYVSESHQFGISGGLNKAESVSKVTSETVNPSPAIGFDKIVNKNNLGQAAETFPVLLPLPQSQHLGFGQTTGVNTSIGSSLFSKSYLDYLNQFPTIDMATKEDLTKGTIEFVGDFIYNFSVPNSWHLEDIEKKTPHAHFLLDFPNGSCGMPKMQDPQSPQD